MSFFYQIVIVKVFNVALNNIGIFNQNRTTTNSFFNRPRLTLIRGRSWPWDEISPGKLISLKVRVVGVDVLNAYFILRADSYSSHRRVIILI